MQIDSVDHFKLHDLPYSEFSKDYDKKDPLDNRTLVCTNKILETMVLKLSIMFLQYKF